MRFLSRSLPLTIAALLPVLTWPAAADPPDIAGQAGSDAYEIIGEQANESASGGTAGTAPASDGGSAGASGGEPKYSEFQWIVVCTTPSSANGGDAVELDCMAAQSCADARERRFRLWGLSIETGGWAPLESGCFGAAPDAPEPARPQVTEAMVLNEIRRIGLPVLEARTQPEDKTLVNFDTIFYTQAQPFSTTVTLLGQRVEILADPAEFTWHHGDGTTSTTATPGAPYPSKDITYRYGDADVTVLARVDVTYTARFRVGNGGWQNISETVTITGTETPLRVAEATGTLSGDYG